MTLYLPKKMDKELRKCQLFQMYKQKHVNYKQYENPM